MKTKALTAAYYLKAQKYAYWDGCSTGGRQGYKIIQTHANDYNGYLVGAPAFNWTNRHDAAERRQVDHLLVLDAVAKAAAGCDQRVGQCQRSERDGKIGLHSQTSSAPSKTGPLMQDRTRLACSSPCLTGTTQL